MKPILCLLKMPFVDKSGDKWFCSHCALLEGALLVNPHWKDSVEIRRINYKKPREELINLLGQENQWLPALVIEMGRALTNPIEIANYLSEKYGGAAPHP